MIHRYSRDFWLLSISSYLFFSSFTMILAELPDYLSRLGGKELIGLIIALFTLSAGLSRPFSGKLADHWGRIPVMIIGATASFIAGMLYPFMMTVWGFFLIRFLHGFSAGFMPTATSAFIADIVPADRRGEALGISSFFATIGMASGPAVGSLIFMEFGINTLFYISASFAIGSILILIGLKETLQNHRSFSPGMLKIGWVDVFEPRVLLPCSIMVLTTLSFGTIITLAPDFSKHLSIQNKGLFYTVFTVSSLLVRVVGGRLSDKYGRPAILKFSTVMLFVSMVVLGLSETQFQFFSGAFLFGLGYGLNSPTLFAWTIDLSPSETRGRGISTLFIFLEVGIGLGALLSGTAYAGEPNRFPVIFGVVGFFSLVAFLILLFRPKMKAGTSEPFL